MVVTWGVVEQRCFCSDGGMKVFMLAALRGAPYGVEDLCIYSWLLLLLIKTRGIMRAALSFLFFFFC
jgi:hypothetical protein